MSIKSAVIDRLSSDLRQCEADKLALATALRAFLGHRGEAKDEAYAKCHRQARLVLDDIGSRALDYDSDD